jgi:hypothetical protein
MGAWPNDEAVKIDTFQLHFTDEHFSLRCWYPNALSKGQNLPLTCEAIYNLQERQYVQRHSAEESHTWLTG